MRRQGAAACWSYLAAAGWARHACCESEKHLEIDLVCPDPDDADGLLVGEAKWKRLTQLEQARVLHDLEDKWRRCALAARHPKVRSKVFDATCIG